jgi:hypothetical protein
MFKHSKRSPLAVTLTVLSYIANAVLYAARTGAFSFTGC